MVRISYKNLFVIILLLLHSSLPALAQKTINARIEKQWTVNSARQEAFVGVHRYVDVSWAHPFDMDFELSRQAIIIKQVHFNDRDITVLENGVYSVSNYSDNKSFAYLPDGKLYNIGFFAFSDGIKTYGEHILRKEYPVKCLEYSYPGGKLTGISLAVSWGDNYYFSPSGKLLGHCKGDICYNTKGNIITRRTSITEDAGNEY